MTFNSAFQSSARTYFHNAKLCGTPGFWENVLDSFSASPLRLHIQTLLSVLPTRLVFWCAKQFRQNEPRLDGLYKYN